MPIAARSPCGSWGCVSWPFPGQIVRACTSPPGMMRAAASWRDCRRVPRMMPATRPLDMPRRHLSRPRGANAPAGAGCECGTGQFAWCRRAAREDHGRTHGARRWLRRQGVASCPETIGLATGPADLPWQGIKGLPVPGLDSEMNVCRRDMLRAGRPIAAFLDRRSPNPLYGEAWNGRWPRSGAWLPQAAPLARARRGTCTSAKLSCWMMYPPCRFGTAACRGGVNPGHGQGGFVQSR